jgi:hypothetical protein
MLSQTEANLAQNIAAFPSTSPLTSGTVFSFTGSIKFTIIGRVIHAIQAQATTVKLSVVCDSLASFDICSTLDLNGFPIGSLLTITGTAANAMVGTTGVGVAAPGQANAITATCIKSGTITVTYGAASTGAIEWEIQWTALNAEGNVTPA